MRRISIAFVCVAGVFASQSCLADSPVRMYFSRANTSFEQFRQDNGDCMSKTTKMVQTTSYATSNTHSSPPICNAGGGSQPICTGSPGIWPSISSPRQTVYYKHNNAEFLRCMLAKGYHESPTAPHAESVPK
jgi:hypothetical protein